MTIEDTLKEIDMIGELLEKKMGKKRFEAAIKKVNEDNEKEREDNSQ
jgi:hypothetical protein